MVGSRSGLDETFLVSVRPTKGMRWRDQDDWRLLRKRFRDGGVHVAIIVPEGGDAAGDFWVRVGFFFFYDSGYVQKLCHILNEAVMSD